MDHDSLCMAHSQEKKLQSMRVESRSVEPSNHWQATNGRRELSSLHSPRIHIEPVWFVSGLISPAGVGLL